MTGAITLAPVAAHELLQVASVLPRASEREEAVPPHEFSFRIDRGRAVDGALQPGERIDLLATYGVDQGGYTAEIASGAVLLRMVSHAGDLTAPDTVVLTVGLDDMSSVLAVAHAAVTDVLTVVRSPEADDQTAVPSYQPPGPGPTVAVEP